MDGSKRQHLPGEGEGRLKSFGHLRPVRDANGAITSHKPSPVRELTDNENLVLPHLCRRHKSSLWGQDYIITPRLVDWIHGDGLQVIWFEPMDTRPNYYVARIDSKICVDNCGKPPVFCDEVYDDLCMKIEDQYGRSWERWEADNGRTYERNRGWPAISVGDGGSWGKLTRLKQSDKRTESEIRKFISAMKGKR
jgi:hypothetical protein